MEKLPNVTAGPGAEVAQPSVQYSWTSYVDKRLKMLLNID